MERNKLIEKIKKLLALANGKANMAEAQSAMLKAQKLMVENNIVISSTETGRRNVIRLSLITPGNYNFRFSLAKIISKNFGCERCINTKTKEMYIYGCAGDVEIAVEVFNYAYQFCHHKGLEERRKAKAAGLNCYGILNTYGEGFVDGLEAAYNEQCKSLVVVKPQEVKDYGNKYVRKSSRQYSRQENVSDKVFYTGYRAGYEFADKDKKRLSA